jgi:hypothetical protein
MIKMLMKLLLNSLPNPMHTLDIARLKMSYLYVKSIKTFRLLFVSLLGIGISLVFLLSSLILFHASIFLYAPLSPSVKMWIGLLFAAIYFGIAFMIFSKIFSESRWLEIFHVKNPSSSNTEEDSKENEDQRVKQREEQMSHV